jgi:hypothetical protein
MVPSLADGVGGKRWEGTEEDGTSSDGEDVFP